MRRITSPLYRRVAPSTMYYRLVKLVYTKGLRPRPGSMFYSPVYDREARRMGGVY